MVRPSLASILTMRFARFHSHSLVMDIRPGNAGAGYPSSSRYPGGGRWREESAGQSRTAMRRGHFGWSYCGRSDRGCLPGAADIRRHKKQQLLLRSCAATGRPVRNPGRGDWSPACLKGALVKQGAAVTAAQGAGFDIFRHGSVHVEKIKAKDLVIEPEQEMPDTRQVENRLSRDFRLGSEDGSAGLYLAGYCPSAGQAADRLSGARSPISLMAISRARSPRIGCSEGRGMIFCKTLPLAP